MNYSIFTLSHNEQTHPVTLQSLIDDSDILWVVWAWLLLYYKQVTLSSLFEYISGLI